MVGKQKKKNTFGNKCELQMLERRDKTSPLTMWCEKTKALCPPAYSDARHILSEVRLCRTQDTPARPYDRTKHYDFNWTISSRSVLVNFLSTCGRIFHYSSYPVSSWCWFPSHCEKQLRYLLIKSLPFLHISQLSAITALNERLNVESLLGVKIFKPESI